MEYVTKPLVSSPNSLSGEDMSVDLPPATPPKECLSQAQVASLARRSGFTEAGAIGVPYPNSALDAERFSEFIDAGYAGTMQYLSRRNEEGTLVRGRVTVPFPWARSIIVCLAGYNSAAPLSTEPAPSDSGWIARYAWSSRRDEKGQVRPSDYHKVLLKRLRMLESELHSIYGEFEARAFVDTGPVVERSVARAAGLGWTGKNTCLIHPKLGSWNFLAVLVTSLNLPETETPLSVPDRCGSCTRCLDACPTDALFEPYRMDATRCISYLTIEHRGTIDENLAAGMGRQVFGCDICQDVCPWNRKSPIAVSLHDGSGLEPRAELVSPSLEWLASLQETDFERLFNGSPVRRTGFSGLRRNLSIAMGNSGLQCFLPQLRLWAQQESEAEPTPLQSAARWAIRRLMQT